MSNCPACDKHLRLTDWRPNCPHCGVNLTFYDFEERFMNDAKYTELGFAKIRVKIARLKAAFIGSKLAVFRLVVCILPLVSFMIPYSSLVVKFPFFTRSYSLSIIGIIDLLRDGALNPLLKLRYSDIFGEVFSAYFLCMLFFIITAFFAVLAVLFTICSFISIKKMSAAVCFISFCAIVCASADIFFIHRFGSIAAHQMPTLIDVSASFGAYITAAAFVIVIVANYILYKNGIKIEYKPGDLYRVEIAKKLKLKEVTLDELPLPIWESEEEKIVRLRLEDEDNKKFQARNEKGRESDKNGGE